MHRHENHNKNVGILSRGLRDVTFVSNQCGGILTQLGELSFNKNSAFEKLYNENLQVKISRDCQELEPSVGEQLASLLYLEPDSDLMAVSLAAESKREEEKAKGVNRESGSENPDIVPFEDDEEEEEDESEEEDENLGQVFGAQGRGRGRGRGMMWPHICLLHVVLVLSMEYEVFPLICLSPYGPRFSGDFAGPTSGMMFPVRPSGGFGMMMGPGRPPFMGGMGVGATPAARASRPLGIAPFYMPPPTQPSQNSNQAKRDQNAPNSDRNEGSAHAKDQEMAGSAGDEGQYQQRGKAQQDHYSAGNSLRNDESESEDEAPRRSRHGEGKKQRRSLETDSIAVSDGLYSYKVDYATMGSIGCCAGAIVEEVGCDGPAIEELTCISFVIAIMSAITRASR
ncbi:cleavage and polyadenylation specificity factor 30 [Sesamum angolense]|uniref:Cleavage and polyadenylation specificity factor 30 n=1 Tax=Sesamum angolense TaxID=2727404 RepID=A0AAE1WTK3_9LAMI|nr:cleavage and polyadenylation specificity factor 30 [Sesamum angolense]